MAKPSIFVSHISEEGDLAKILKQHLEADFNRKFVFVSSDLESGIGAGEHWLKCIEVALRDASVELILCSRLSINRQWVNFEAGAAWLKRIRIIPICHSGLQVGDLPMPYSVLNAIQADQEHNLNRLYGSIAKTLAVDIPNVDFSNLANAVREFERSYAINVRMRGQAAGLVDARLGERLVGKWEGSGRDLEIPREIKYKTKLSYDLSLDLHRQQNSIGGELYVHTRETNENHKAFIEMVNRSGEYFYFRYWLAVPHANHCGFMVMRLSTLGDVLEGAFLTNKTKEPQIGLGKIVFRQAEG